MYFCAVYTSHSYYWRVAFILLRASDYTAPIQGHSLCKGIHYARAFTMQGQSLCKGSHYARAVTIQGQCSDQKCRVSVCNLWHGHSTCDVSSIPSLCFPSTGAGQYLTKWQLRVQHLWCLPGQPGFTTRGQHWPSVRGDTREAPYSWCQWHGVILSWQVKTLVIYHGVDLWFLLSKTTWPLIAVWPRSN